MLGSSVVYLGLVTAAVGLVRVVKPIRWLRVGTRRRGLGVAGAGVLLACTGQTLIAIRNFGQPPPRIIQDAIRAYTSIHDIATHSTFVSLADDAPREVVDGTIVRRPPGPRETLTPGTFRKALPPGYALAAMNDIITPDGSGGSCLPTVPPRADRLPPTGGSSTQAAP